MVFIIEQFLKSRRGEPSGGGDRVISGPFYGIVDGVTTGSDINWGTPEKKIKGSTFIADLLKEILENEEHKEWTGKEIIAEANRRITQEAEKRDIDLKNIKHRDSAIFVIYSPEHNMIYHFDEYQFAFRMENGSIQYHYKDSTFEKVMVNMRLAAARRLREKGINPFEGGKDLAREEILPYIKRRNELLNQKEKEGEWIEGLPFSEVAFESINGFTKSVNQFEVPKGVKEIIIASDGFKGIKPTLKESLEYLEMKLELDRYCTGILAGTKRKDPLGWSFDDASYIRIRL